MRTATLLAAATLAVLTLASLGCEHKVREARGNAAPLTAVAGR